MKKLFSMLSLTFLMSCVSKEEKKMISPNDISAENGIIIDVREKDEVASGMLEGAYWFPLSEMNNDPEKAAKSIEKLSQGKTVYAYCRSGGRSGKYTDFLKQKGIKAENIGGYEGLLRQGFQSKTVNETQLKSGSL